jgi:SecD/SecF fusion protein
MHNKSFVIALTAVLVLLCAYYLSFTFVSNHIENQALRHATDAHGIVDLNKKQVYIDSLWDKEVYSFLGITSYTYKEVKENRLNLGLDLQGGMHVTLEVSPADIIRQLAGEHRADSMFTKTVSHALQLQKGTQANFSSLFFDSFRKNYPNKKLSSIFYNTVTRGKLKSGAGDNDVIKFVNTEIDQAIDRSYVILRNRLDQFGTSSPNIQRLPGTGRIQVEIPGADNPQRIRKLLQGVARLEFWDVIPARSIAQKLEAVNTLVMQEHKSVTSPTRQNKDNDLSSLLGEKDSIQQSSSDKAEGLDSLASQHVPTLFSLAQPAGSFSYALRDTSFVSGIFKMPEVKSLMRTIEPRWAYKSESNMSTEKTLQLYFIDIGRTGIPKLSGEVVTSARVGMSSKGGGTVVDMTMNVAGARMWAKMTKEAAGKTPQGQIAIVLDNVVYSAPYVNDEIPNGNSEISGSFTLEEAKDLANVLQAGSLPVPCHIVEEAIVGPTLGQSAQQSGLISSACGLVLVVLFMIAYYARAGWVANFALIFNIFFILGILAQPAFGTALTLPGIAGIVLTMGMAVDANVLIYERIKEERDRGKPVREAVNTGFKLAFASIFDSNLTTLITGIFLFLFGQGPIKGFAVTLIIGIITSFFTAIYISRIVIDWLISRSPETLSFDTPISRLIKGRKKFQFVKYSRSVFLTSSFIVVVGLVLMLVNGFNLGVDFKGGRSYIISFDQPIAATEMKESLTESFKGASTEVKNYGGNNVMKVTTAYEIEDNSDNGDQKVRQALIEGVSKYTGLKYREQGGTSDTAHFTIESSSKVGSAVADDIKNSAWKASILSLAGIFVYILIRFRKWQYSLGAIIATVHDAFFVIAAFAICNVLGISFEIDQVFVAALLTIIGYSINDTVIIFDRIRENMANSKQGDMPVLVNDAINSTLSRTIITSGTTLLAVLVLLLFGGEVLRGFSFAMLIGVVVGTYSSIYIAAPFILYLRKSTQTPEKEKKLQAV